MSPGGSSDDPALPADGTLVLVHGLGRFGGGREAIRHLVRRGCRVRVADGSDSESLRAVRATFGSQPNIEWHLGSEDLELLDGVELFVISPAVPDHHPLLQAARSRGIPCTQECELFLAAYPGRVVGVTGTNGKSSTATLLHRALQTAGVDSLLGGNIGHSLLADSASWRAEQVAVFELSSFQLERFASHRKLHGAVFTRIGSDHLDRHGTLANYQQAKARLAEAATAFVIHAGDDSVAGDFATNAAQRLTYAVAPGDAARANRHGSPSDNSARIQAGWVSLLEGELVLHREALRLLGDFQLENVLAASLAARLLGAHTHAIGLAMATAAPLPFRLQLLTTIDGVRIYDNAVSTEAESTRQALMTLSDGRKGPARVHWLGGGKSKDGDYGKVAALLDRYATSAHAFGTAAQPLTRACTIPTSGHERLAKALEAALAAARPGDALLFSPGFASFDQYPNFRARALEFHALLRERRATAAVVG